MQKNVLFVNCAHAIASASSTYLRKGKKWDLPNIYGDSLLAKKKAKMAPRGQ